MKKLELKHLAPYLPYKLVFMLSDIGIFNIDSEYQKPIEAYKKLKLTNILISERIEVELEHDNGWGIGFVEREEIKPILRPLSDTSKEIEINGEKFIPYIKLLEQNNFDVKNMNKSDLYGYKDFFTDPDLLMYNDVIKLIEWHFDIYGLIEEELAININDLKDGK